MERNTDMSVKKYWLIFSISGPEQYTSSTFYGTIPEFVSANPSKVILSAFEITEEEYIKLFSER